MTFIRLSPLLLIFLLSSCIYKMDIEQGNAIDEAKVEKLEVGMSKKQVKFLLGNPAIKDVYHANKWHYLRSLKHNNGAQTDLSTMVLEFKDDTLVTIKGKL